MDRRKLWFLAPLVALVATFAAIHAGSSPAKTTLTVTEPSASTSAPIRISWQDITGMNLPISSTDGPRCLTAWHAGCFARTPDGVSIAAAHLLVRTFAFVGPTTFDPTIERQVVGPDTTALHRLTEQAYTQAKSDPATGDEALRVDDGWLVGFHLTRYSPTSAQVDVLFRQSDPDGQIFTSFIVDMTWCQNDWCLIAPPWGDWSAAATAVRDPDPGYYRDYDALAQP